MKTKIYLVSVMLTALTATEAQTNANQVSTTEASAGNKRILVRLGGKTVPDDMSKENPLAVKTANISGESERNTLLKFAEALNYQAQRLRREAQTKTGLEQELDLQEATKYETRSLQSQIKASEILGTINQVKFNSNKESINKLFASVELDADKASKTRSLITSSEKNMQKARDLRQEAYTYSNLGTRLGALSNAEEEELTALGEQGEAINLLYKTNKKSM